jgi:DNA repair exonuclease SbcCD ATPase subunit
MNIQITKLLLTNFKCFREKEISFDGDITTIRGRNGAGKTTIADAILFCLFGKNTAGQSDLELFKTRENGQVIPNLDHSVEMEICVRELLNEGQDENAFSAKTITLRRTIKEVWVKKRGSEESVFKNNTVEYFVNGESLTKADFEKYIATLVDEKVFRAITNPTYFPSLKWQDQRSFLTTMVGEIEPEYIAGNDESLSALVKQLDGSNDDIISYRKHLSYQIKEIKNKLDKIPVRLEEQNKALPEKLDWNAIETELTKAQTELKEVGEKITAIKQGNGSDIRRAELRVSIDELRKKMNDIEDKARNAIKEKTNVHDQNVLRLLVKFNEELNNQKLMEQTIEADKRLIKRCEDSLMDYAEELEHLRIAWPTRKFEFDSQMEICPTCGQPLPPELLEERKNRLRDNFNKEIEAEKQSLRKKAAKVKQDMADATRELETTKEKLEADTKSLETIKTTINTVFSEKAKEEKKLLPTLDVFLTCNEEYQAALRERKCLESELSSVCDSDDDKKTLAELESQYNSYACVIESLQQQLHTKEFYDHIIALIDGINEEQKILVKQLSELERKEDIATRYQYRQNQLLEERINKHFKLVQWRLFRTVNNGGDSFEEPFCECYVNGIPYHAGLNQAMRLNAGLDICEALCKFYNVSAPIVIDNAESNLNIYQTTGQQIRLQVFDSELNLV